MLGGGLERFVGDSQMFKGLQTSKAKNMAPSKTLADRNANAGDNMPLFTSIFNAKQQKELEAKQQKKDIEDSSSGGNIQELLGDLRSLQTTAKFPSGAEAETFERNIQQFTKHDEVKAPRKSEAESGEIYLRFLRYKNKKKREMEILKD